MKQSRKCLVLVAIVLCLASMIIGVFADTNADAKALTASLVDYTFRYKGKEVPLISTASKKEVKSFKYNDEIYVPIGYIAELLMLIERW